MLSDEKRCTDRPSIRRKRKSRKTKKLSLASLRPMFPHFGQSVSESLSLSLATIWSGHYWSWRAGGRPIHRTRSLLLRSHLLLFHHLLLCSAHFPNHLFLYRSCITATTVSTFVPSSSSLRRPLPHRVPSRYRSSGPLFTCSVSRNVSPSHRFPSSPPVVFTIFTFRSSNTSPCFLRGSRNR